MKKLNFIKIGTRRIGPHFKPLVIFELGINHNGSLKLAKKIVDDAIKAGAEIIKHQTHIPDDEMSLEAKKIIPINANKNIYNLIEECSLNEIDELQLKKYIEKKGAIFLSTPFSRKAVDRLIKFNVNNQKQTKLFTLMYKKQIKINYSQISTLFFLSKTTTVSPFLVLQVSVNLNLESR